MQQPAPTSSPIGKTLDYVTAWQGDLLIGLPIARVQDVFRPHALTPVPLAPPAIAGLLNSRGRIITMIEMSTRLGLAHHHGGEARIAIGVELEGESYGLLVDGVGEILSLPEVTWRPTPASLERRFAQLIAGIHQLEDHILIVLDIDRILALGPGSMAAKASRALALRSRGSHENLFDRR